MSNQLILDSLQRRMKALFSLYDDAIDSMDLEHVNHFEREGVVPIAFCLFHYANVHDASSPSTTMANIAPSMRWSISESATLMHSPNTCVRCMREHRPGSNNSIQQN
jgi:hypothetical protein